MHKWHLEPTQQSLITSVDVSQTYRKPHLTSILHNIIYFINLNLNPEKKLTGDFTKRRIEVSMEGTVD